ncbi:flagellar motor switch protein FliG [Porcipelethomonas sp.]|uniref:flagellar motor switch protein FliG n=1 Tax=Porcipelethomonas sp. TaxID=2981675 RepID=UPI003EF378C7
MKRPAPSDEQVTAANKAAAFMVALGEETAAEIYKYLDDDEVEQLSLEIASIDSLSQDEIKAVMDEFYEIFIAQKISAEGGQQYSMNVLTNAFGKEKAKMIMQRIHDSNRAFEFLKNVDYKTILTMLSNELPQTIALVLTHINSKKSAQIIAEFPNDIQVEIFKRIADMDSISPEIVRNVEEIMSEKLSSVGSVDMVEFGGVNYLADVMNNLDMQTEKTIMEELNDSDPELVDEIQKRMFVFDDIAFLDNREIQAFLRECDTKDITVALKAANPEVTKVIFSNMSQRQQETIKTDLQYLHNVRMRDVEDAQRKIIATIRRLEETGEIVMSKGGLDEIIP